MATRTPSAIRTYSRKNRNYPRSPPVIRQVTSETGVANQAALEGELLVLRDRVSRIENNTKKVTKVLSMIQVSVRDTVSCEICFSPFKNPHLLECGHTFCLQCICQWLETQVLRFAQNNTYKPLSALQLLSLREPQLFPAVFVSTSKSLRIAPHPICTCPVCRATLSRKPVKAREMERAVDGLVSSMAIGRRSTDSGRVGPRSAQANRLFERCLLL